MSDPEPRVLFVTGTDTGVGKTHVTRGLIRVLRRTGITLVPLKLVETGCDDHAGTAATEDGRLLAHAAQLDDAVDVVAPIRFTLPAAPMTAARHQNTTLSIDTLMRHVAAAEALSKNVVFEGAGGALVPLTPLLSFADFAAQLHADAVVVARDALGTLNHTMLTVEALTRRGIHIRAIVVNETSVRSDPRLQHLETLRELLPSIRIIGPLTWQPNATDDDIADALTSHGADWIPGIFAR